MLELNRYGSGHPLLLIHGLMSSQENWKYLLPELSARYEVITINLPGHGGSSVPKGIESMEDLVDEIVETLDELKIDQATWIGHSWGGYITAEAIASEPERVRSAVLVYSSPYADTPEAIARRNAALQRIDTEPMAGIVRDLVPTYFAPSDPPSELENAILVADQVSPEGLRMALTTIRDRDDHVLALRDHPEIPVLVVEGELDTAIRRIDFELDHLTVARTGSSHVGPTTDPQALLDVLLPWLARNV